MKIQRFEGSDAQEALRLARQALGPDAVILQTRRVQVPGLKGLVGRPRVEVLAAVDPDARPPRAVPPPAGDPRPTTGRAGTAEWTPLASPMPPERDEVSALRLEVAELRRALERTAGRGSAGVPDGEAGRGAPAPPAGRPPEPLSEGTPALSRSALAAAIRKELVGRTIEMQPGRSTAVALVGPTGSGKTTTLAKIAAAAVHGEQKRVAFITVDTYRIGAVEQLDAYARLLEIPVTVAYSPAEVRAARTRYADCDLVLMDTIGRGPGSAEQLEELALLLDAARPDEVHLLLDTRGSRATQASVLRGFQALRPTHLLLSKLDEAPDLGDALAAALDAGLPLSYVTFGQRVPEDLAAAEPAELAQNLLGGT